MADSEVVIRKGSNVFNYLITALLTAQTGLLSWTLTTISRYQANSEEERKQLLDHALKAATSADKAEKVAERTAEKVESTKAAVDSTKKTVESTQKVAAEVKKAVEAKDDP